MVGTVAEKQQTEKLIKNINNLFISVQSKLVIAVNYLKIFVSVLTKLMYGHIHVLGCITAPHDRSNPDV
jgi:hypothetical protein